MIVYVDIDGVLCNNTYGKYEEAIPIKKNIKKINKKFDGGDTIILWTSRGTSTGIDWRELTERQLKEWGVKYHSLEFGKPEFDEIYDDKAKNIEGI
ncbi:MAG: hypothetical protein KAJ44_00250 [Thermoplasmatales archaeon]|nr:hypothetical protein [Thermoplasmatales archaeon]